VFEDLPEELAGVCSRCVKLADELDDNVIAGSVRRARTARRRRLRARDPDLSRARSRSAERLGVRVDAGGQARRRPSRRAARARSRRRRARAGGAVRRPRRQRHIAVLDDGPIVAGFEGDHVWIGAVQD
jgi:hypothetical protein